MRAAFPCGSRLRLQRLQRIHLCHGAETLKITFGCRCTYPSVHLVTALKLSRSRSVAGAHIQTYTSMRCGGCGVECVVCGMWCVWCVVQFSQSFALPGNTVQLQQSSGKLRKEPAIRWLSVFRLFAEVHTCTYTHTRTCTYTHTRTCTIACT